MFIVGLTGGIGSGKSVIANLFADLGVPVIDADIIAREITTPGKTATITIEKHFGNTVINPDGTLDRAAIREHIFNHSDEKEWLENLLHPLIRTTMIDNINQLENPYCIAVIPLLAETKFFDFLNRILVVDTEEEIQIKRAMTRDKLSRREAIKMIHAQAKRAERLAIAHDVIHNNGALDELRLPVEKLHQQYLQLASASR